MRRHRERQVQGVSAMRASLEQLTQQYRELSALTSSNPQLLQDYHEATKSSQRLQMEHLQLQRTVIDWHKTMAKVALWLTDHPQVAVPIPTKLLQDPTGAVPFQFTQLSESAMQQVIRRSSVNLRQREQQLSPLAIPSVRTAHRNSNFGWSIICDLSNENDVFVSMTKRFQICHHVSSHRLHLGNGG